MRTERNSAIRLLQLLMVASLVFPVALFVYASYNDYRDVYAVADERIDRSLDVLQEQALKVFETVDRIFPEVGEVVRGLSDDQIRAAQASLTPRLQRIVGVMPQVRRSCSSAATAARWLQRAGRAGKRRRLCRSALLCAQLRRRSGLKPAGRNYVATGARRRRTRAILFEVSYRCVARRCSAASSRSRCRRNISTTFTP